MPRGLHDHGIAKEYGKRAPEKSLGWAIDKVKAPESLTPLVAQLLHNIAIFQNLEDALTARKKHSEIAAVTLDGELVSTEGVIFGGSREASADSLLERKARISALSDECSEIVKQRDAFLKKYNDVREVLERATSELEDARRAHGEHDDASYVTEEIKSEPFARDCLKVAEQTIADLKLADAETLAEWRKEAAMKVDEAIATAQKEAPPEGDKEDWCALSTRDLVDQLEND